MPTKKGEHLCKCTELSLKRDEGIQCHILMVSQQIELQLTLHNSFNLSLMKFNIKDPLFLSS